MQSYEYLALPAPSRSQKVKGLKTPAERYAHQITVILNELAAEGWEFWRSECLPSEERRGLTGTTTVQNHLLIFRRLSAEALAEHPVSQEPAARSEAPLVLDTPRARPDTPSVGAPSGEARVYDTRREPAFNLPPRTGSERE
jgi:hypothetical protein